MTSVRVAVDTLGGDRAPAEVVAGALEARSDHVEPVLFGPETLDASGLELVPTTDEIGMEEKPAEAVRAKPDSSLVAACRAVGAGRAAAVVSAGNTGAMLAASLVEIRRLRGVLRPAIAVVIPSRKGPSVLLDCGANADSRPEHLRQFAEMGSIFAEEILGTENPEVRLLSIGEEAEKGDQLTIEAHQLLAASDINFGGNVESRWLLEGAGDVVVCGGFTGNVCLKLLEGTILSVFDGLRTEIGGTTRGKARWPPDPTRRAEASLALRSGGVRRCISPRSPRHRRDRARQLFAARDRERDPACSARRRARRRHEARRPTRG